VPPDDPTVDDAVSLYRLLNPTLDIAWDDDEGRWIVKSSAFQNSTGTDQMSVVLGDQLDQDGRSPADARRTKPDWYVVSLIAGDMRQEDQGVLRDPVPEEPAHGNVVGEKGKSRRRRFKDLAVWVVEPSGEGPAN